MACLAGCQLSLADALRDRCERLCSDVGDALAECRTESVSWADLGATDREDWVRGCRQGWNATAADLTARELELAIDVCIEARDEVELLDCDEVMALYGPG